MALRNTLEDAASQLRAVDSRPPLLPLFHTFRSTVLEAVLSSGFIDIRSRCPRDPSAAAAYFFYGVPAYVPPRSDSPRGVGTTRLEDTEFPVALGFRPRASGRSCDLYPFDTGAIARGHYGHLFGATNSLDEYVLQGEAGPRRAAELVSHFFGGNAVYLSGRPIPGVRGSQRQCERAIRQIHRLSRGPGGIPDDRARTIEVVARARTPLSEAVCAIVPDLWLQSAADKATFIRKLAAAGASEHTIVLVPYRVFPVNFGPEELVKALVSAARRYLAMQPGGRRR